MGATAYVRVRECRYLGDEVALQVMHDLVLLRLVLVHDRLGHVLRRGRPPPLDGNVEGLDDVQAEEDQDDEQQRHENVRRGPSLDGDDLRRGAGGCR